MKLTINHEIPVQPKDYEGLARLLRTKCPLKGVPAVASPNIQRILKADPKFAAYFRRGK